MGFRCIYPKLHHGEHENVFATSQLGAGWASHWKERGVGVVGWGWLKDDPIKEAELAVELCREFDLDGYIANAETDYEGEHAWKSAPFVKRFRDLAPRAPLGLSYIGLGVPYRNLDWKPWIQAGAAFLPQCYWNDTAISILPTLVCAVSAGLPMNNVFPTLGTSGFAHPYPTANYTQELEYKGMAPGFNIWLLDSTSDDILRGLPA